ncbi:MAG: hypothetical protein N2423_07550 [Novosphingobium sp.]|nr:hypothetical protein [Novosphingobium sp.]
MSWVKSAAFALGAVTLSPPGIAEAGIVVASSGPSAAQFPVGKKIEDNARITLRDGDSVTVLVRGSTRVLKGAGTFNVSGIGSATRLSTFTALVRPRGATRVRPGAVRSDGASLPVRNPNLWYIDVNHSGPFCILDPEKVRLWRPDITAPATYRISSGGAAISISFPKGEMLAAWDVKAMPVRESTSYAIQGPTGTNASMSFAFLSAPPQTPEAAAELLIKHGCKTQLDLLAATLEAREDGAGW